MSQQDSMETKREGESSKEGGVGHTGPDSYIHECCYCSVGGRLHPTVLCLMTQEAIRAGAEGRPGSRGKKMGGRGGQGGKGGGGELLHV